MFQSLSHPRTICACLLVLAATVARGEDTVSIRNVGLDGYFVVGRTAIVTAEVTLDASTEVVIRVNASDPLGNLVHFQSDPTTIKSGEPTEVAVPFQIGKLGVSLTVEVLDGDNVIATTTRAFGEDSGLLSPKTNIIGLIGQPQGLPQWHSARRIMVRFRPTKARFRRREDDDVDRSEADAKKLADEIAASLESGDTSFEALISQYSEGKQPGLFTSADEVDDAIPFLRSMPTGEIRGPFKTSREEGSGETNAFHFFERQRLPERVIAEQLEDRLYVDLTTETLPDEASGLSAMRTLVIAGDYDFNESQVGAIIEWIQFGGHLVLSIGRNTEAFRTSALGEAIQNRIPVGAEISRLAELPGLRSFTDHRSAIRISTGAPISAARIGETDGVTLVSGSDGPLIEQVGHGFGRITMIGLDIDKGPLADWSGLPALMNRLVFERKSAQRGDGAIQSESIGHNGITDIATQLNSISASFPSVKRPSSWMAMLMILGYMLAIGPIDYLIVHRILKRPRLTWLTFPAWVIGGCALGIWMANSSNGTDMRMNETSIVDIDATDSKACRVRSWYSVYTPEFRRASIKVDASNGLMKLLNGGAVEPSLLTWNGIPENVFGGMLRSGGASLGSVAYDSNPATVDGLPIPVWSTANLQNEWRGTNKSTITSRLKTNSARKLTGSVTFDLPFTIKNWFVAHGLTGYYPRDAKSGAEIRSGQTWSAQSPTVQSRDLESYLTGVQIVHVERKAGEGGSSLEHSKQEYDALQLNPQYVLRFLSLHDAAGGTNYTGLTNHLLSEHDLSQTIELNRAVLIGEIDAPAGSVKLDGEELEATRSRTFVRIMLPVERSERSRR